MTARGLSDATGRLTLAAGAAIVLGGTLAALLVGPRLGPPPARTPSSTARLDVSGDWRPLAWAPDGTRLLVSGSSGIALVGLRAAPPPGLSGVTLAAWRPPSGHELAVIQAGAAPGESALRFIADGAGSPSVPLPVEDAATIAWAADGRTWAVAARSGATVVVGRVGSGQVLTVPDLGAPIALSPDGATLAGRMASTGALALVPISGSSSVGNVTLAAGQATVTIGADGLVAFSPDGHWLALADAGGALRVIPADAGAPPTTVEAGIEPSSVAWAPDRDQLLALRSGAGRAGGIVATLATAGIEVRQLGPARGLSWAAGGGVILVMADGHIVASPLSGRAPAAVLATDADPACPALQGRGGALVYCVPGGLRVLGP